MTKGWLLFIAVLGLLLAFSVAVGTATASPGILYAKPSGSGNCSNWANACTLQTALGAAADGDEIWVATGVHTPTTTGTDRTATFQLVSGVGVYGGFAGTETSREERDWQSNITVLSGDIDDNDTTDPNGVITTTANITGTNSYHVVRSSSVTETCMLDGFTITGGYADKLAASDGYGGGMSNSNSSPTLANLTFSGNSAKHGGGGMRNWAASSPTLANVTFGGNSAGDFGGGMCNMSSSPTLTNVTFSGNSGGHGGGMCNVSSSPTLTNVTFSGNSADVSGGGMVNWATSSPTLTNSILWGNTAISGTQIYNHTSTPTISHSLVEGSGGSDGSWDVNLGSDGGGNIDADPQFVDADGPDDIVGTQDDDLRLSATSPAIDAGDNSAVPADTLDLDKDGDTAETLPFDLDGYPRIVGARVDMGAYEWYEWPQFLTLTKSVINDDGGTATMGDFHAHILGTPVPWGVAQSVISGTCTVSETLQASYSASVWSGDCAPDGVVTLALDEHATCSVTNDDISATLTLTKTVINDDGRTSTAEDFQAYIQGTPVPWGVAQSVISGTYTVSETVQAGYSASAWSGDCAPDGTITLAIGDVKTCSITNDDMAPTVTLAKTVINDDDGTATLSDFQAYLDGDPVPWGVPQPVIPGTHTASESVLLGYVPTMWGGDCNEDGTITVNAGEDALCSITNDDTLHSYVPLVLKNYGS